MKTIDGMTLAVILACFSIDFASKAWARSALTTGVSTPFLPPILRLTLDTNTGAAFSMGSNQGVLVTVLASLVFICLCAWFWRQAQNNFQSPLERFGLAILLGAAFGNLLDRFLYGRVTDFFDFMFFRFPIFNVADVLIDVGVALVLLSNFRADRRGLD